MPAPAQVRGVQPLGTHALFVQICPAAQVFAQVRINPQPSEMGPQGVPVLAQVAAVQVCTPQTLGAPPPPQVWPVTQTPQFTTPPQPSGY